MGSCLVGKRLTLVRGSSQGIGWSRWGRMVGAEARSDGTLVVPWALMRIRNVRFEQLGVVGRVEAVLVNG